MNKRRWALRILSLFVCCALLSGCASGPVTAPESTADIESAAPVATIVPEETEEARKITLRASQVQFKQDKQCILELRVQCESDVSGDVTVRDETGAVVASIRNDGSGEMKTQLPFRRTQLGEGYFIASADGYESESIPYTVQREVTESMVENLFSVTDDLGRFIEESDFADPYSEEAFAAVRRYLEESPQVQGVAENGDALLFSTQDGLIAAYGMGQRTEGFLGFSDTEDVYDSFLAGQDVSEMWIHSDRVPTSEKCIILSPDDDDPTLNEHAMVAEGIVQGYFKEVQCYRNEDALDALKTGRFTDCEMLIFNAHGWQLHRSDGSAMLFFKVADMFDADACIDYLTRTTGSLQTLENPDYNCMENSYGVLSVGVTEDGEAYEEFCLSSLYLENLLRESTFDNTVIYMSVCYGGSDGRLNSFFLEHGASLIFGCMAPLNSGYSVAVLYEMMNAMKTKNADGQYGVYTDGLKNVGRQSVEPLYVHALGYDADSMRIAAQTYAALPDEEKRREEDLPSEYTEQEKINWEYKCFMQIFDLMEAHPEHLLRAVPSGSLRGIRGESLAEGAVVLSDGTPADGAMVSMYRWVDHKFVRYEHQSVVNAQGTYSFTQLPYGVYVARADYMGFTGEAAFTVQETKTAVEQIVIDPGLVLMGDVKWHSADPQNSRQNYDKLMVTPVLTEGSDPLLENFPLLLTKMKENMEGQQEEAASSTAGEQPGFIAWTLENAYSTGACLSLHLSSMSYRGGAMRPLHGEWIYNVDVNTGSLLSFPDLVLENGNDAPLRSGWKALLENYSDSELDYDRADIVERAMQGEIGSWMMTKDGLMLRFDLYEVAAYASGPAEIVLPYESLQGALKNSFFPVKTVSADQENTVRTTQVLQGVMHLPFGGETKRALHLDGQAEHVWVYAMNAENPEKADTLVYYARGAKDETIYLPMCEGNAYCIRWTCGDTEHEETMVFPS